MPCILCGCRARDICKRCALEVSGSGLFDDIAAGAKEAFERVKGAIAGPRQHAPPALRAFLDQYGDATITAMTICRKPIASAIDTALNFISAGTWAKNKEKLGYDRMFHLWNVMLLRMPNGSEVGVMMEKNETVNVQSSNNFTCADALDVKLPRERIKLRDLLANGEKFRGPAFWVYSPVNTGTGGNCQDWQMSILKGNNLNTPALEKFISQDADAVLTGAARNIGVALTDLAGRASILLHGKGVRKKRAKRSRSNAAN